MSIIPRIPEEFRWYLLDRRDNYREQIRKENKKTFLKRDRTNIIMWNGFILAINMILNDIRRDYWYDELHNKMDRFKIPEDDSTPLSLD